MLTIEEISAGNIPILGSYKLQLNKHPLIVIRGNNLDKKKTKGSSNGSGKTLSVSPIPTLVYETTPTSLKKKASKDLLTTKNSFIEMKIDDGKKRIIRKELTTSVKHFITTNGVVSSYRKPEEARQEIQKIFPLSEEAFYSQLFINGRQKSILQVGTATQRFAYLETIFQLNEYDKLNQLVTKDYNHTKRLIQELGVIVAEKQERKKALPAIDNMLLSKKQEEIQAKIYKFGTRVEKYIELHNKSKTYISLVEDLDTKKSLKTLESELEEANVELVDMNKLYKKSVRHYEALEQQEALRGRRQKLKEGIKAIPQDIDILPEINGKVEKLNKRYKEIERALEEVENNNRIYKTAKARLGLQDIKTLPTKYKDKTEKELERLKLKNSMLQKDKVAARQNLKDYIEHNHEAQDCPVCQRGLSIKAAKQLITTLDSIISNCVRKGASLDQYIKIKRYTKEMEDNPYIDEAELEGKFQLCAGNIEKYEAIQDDLKRKENLINRLNDLPKADVVEDTTIPKPVVYEDTIKDLNTRINNLESSVKIHKRLQRLGYEFEPLEDVKEKNKSYELKLSEYRPILQQLQKDLAGIVAKESVYNSIKEDVDRLIGKIRDLKIETKDFKIFEALKKAFGNKGLRKIKTKYYVNQLETTFNKYSPLIFDEKVVFSFQLTDTKFDILCEMNGVIKDVRRLSGAESSCFTLLLILCILPFIPANMRSNLLILDEIESGFDTVCKEKFVTDFLPVLNKIAKNIVIITPLSEQEFYIPNAKTLLVTKKEGKSTIKMVTPGV